MELYLEGGEGIRCDIEVWKLHVFKEKLEAG